MSLGFNRYGKQNVQLLRIYRDSERHEVFELKCKMLLEGNFDESYTKGSNHQIVPTETQKNSLYVLSKKYPVNPIEEWCISVAKDMMERHSHVDGVNLEVELLPWNRADVKGQEHNHFFLKSSNAVRTCKLRLCRDGEISLICGFYDLQIMKTTKSGFAGFIKDQYTTLKEVQDRILCTKVKCVWEYQADSLKNIDWNSCYEKVVQLAIEEIAGDPKTGTHSPSVQQTVYEIAIRTLKEISAIESISFELPNIHYYKVNFDDFDTNLENNNEVFFTFEGASGLIEATINRDPSKSIKPKL